MTTHAIVPTAAIDLGFFSTKYSWLDGSALIRTDQFPSVAVMSDHPQDLPAFQRPEGCLISNEGVPRFVGKGALSMLDGTGQMRGAYPDYSRSQEYKVLFLGALWHLAKDMSLGDAHLKIERLVVGLPMSAMKAHANSLADLCTGTHPIPGVKDPSQTYKVTVAKVHVLSQPQGAMLNLLARDCSASEKTVLVADMGGGTFDWFVAKRMTANVQRSGSHPKGMLNCAQDVCRRIAPESIGNIELVQRIDRALTADVPVATMMGQPVDLTPFLPTANKVVHTCLRDMMLSVGSMDDIDIVLLAGGGAPLVKRVWANVDPKTYERIELEDDPVYANVRGFLEFANFASRNQVKQPGVYARAA